MQIRFRMGVAGVVVVAAMAWLRATAPATMPAAQVTVVTDRPEAVYAIGEHAHFLISVKGGPPLPATGAQVSYILDKDGVPPVTKGTATLEHGQATVEGTLNEPGFLRCRVAYAEVAGQPPITATASAAFDPLKIAPSLPAPDDFDAFWARQKARLAAVPIAPTLTPVASGAEGVESFDVQIPCIPPRPVSGYFSRPRGAAPKSLPAMLQVHAAGVLSSVLSATVNRAKHLHVLAMDINAHGIPNGQPQSFYDDLAKGELKDYPHFGAGDRETCYFLGMFLRMQRAIDFLTSQPEWDGRILIVTGSSQGGGQAIAAAGVDPRVTLITANVPALCDHTGRVVGRIAGWPKLVPPSGAGTTEKALQAARYFDCMNFATRAKAQAVFSVGFIDPVAPPTSIYAMYNNYAGKKQIIPGPLEGHATWKAFEQASDAAILNQLKSGRNE
ncbi:MAG TPA: acetylxylan esterase [Tepidisphaeraceae bacterium]